MNVRDFYHNRAQLGHLPVLAGQKPILFPYRALVPDGNTLGFWHFDEGSGNVYDAAGGNTIVVTGATWGTGSIFGTSLSFDGTDDFGMYAAAKLYNQTNFSIEVLVKSSVANFSGEGPIYVEGTASNNRFGLSRVKNKWFFRWLNTGATAWLTLTSTSTPTWTNWNYLAATSADKVRNIYTNGVADGNDTAATAPYAGLTNTYICKYPEAGYFGTFELAYLRISNVARTAAEIYNNARLLGLA